MDAAALKIRPMRQADAAAVLEIYQQGCDTGHATFAKTAGSWAEWDEAHLADCRLVAQSGQIILGWVALSALYSRCVYRGVAEASLYVSERGRGQGVGGALLRALIDESEAQDYWTLRALIFPENTASLGLFEKHGFAFLARHEKLGLMEHGPMSGQWRDVALLERRSQKAGR